MKGEDFKSWFDLAAGVLAKDRQTAPGGRLMELYERCFKMFAVDRDGSGVHVTSPTLGQDAHRTGVKQLEVSFADYRLTSSLDTFIASVSLDRAREEPNPRQLGELVRIQIKACVRDIDEFIGDLEIPNYSLKTIFEDLRKQKAEREKGEDAKRRERGMAEMPPTGDEQAALGDAVAVGPPDPDPIPAVEPKGPKGRSRATKAAPSLAANAPEPEASVPPDHADDGGIPPKQPAADNARIEDADPDKPLRLYSIDRAIIQSAILMEAAIYLGAAVVVPPPLPPLPPGMPVPPAVIEERANYEKVRAAIRADKDRFDAEADAYDEVLKWVVRAAFKLDDLKDALRDERLRTEVENKLVSVASDLDKAVPLKSLLTRAASYTVTAVLGVLTFLVLVNIAWPYFGYSMLLPIVAAGSAVSLGLLFSQGTLTKQSVLKQQEDLRCWMENILRLNTTRPADMLGVLTTRIDIGGAPPQVVERPRKGEEEDDKLFRFGRFGRVEASWIRKTAVGLMVPFVAFAVCCVPGLLPTMYAFNQIRLPSAEPEQVEPLAAQVVRRVSGREVCEIAKGRLIWQDDRQIYLMHAGRNVVSVARSDATEIRFGASQLKVEPCDTQDAAPAYGDTTIHELSVTNVPVVVDVQANGPAVGPSLSVASNFFLDGRQLAVTAPVDLTAPYVVLSLSTRPVDGFSSSGLLPAEYYALIYKFYRQDEPEQQWTRDVEDAVAPIRAALVAAAESGCSIEVDVQGYASRRNFVPNDPWSNYVLAEGRRASVLLALGFSEGKVEREYGKGRLRISDEEPRIPDKLINQDGSSVLKWNPRFASPEAMKEVLQAWYTQPIEANTRLEEAIARSVVIAIEAEDLSRCGPRLAG